MSEKIKLVFTIMLIFICIPFIIGSFSKTPVNSKVLQSYSDKNYGEEVLPGIVARQISLESEPETLKAQAVIARTVIYKEIVQGEWATEVFGFEQMEEQYGYIKAKEYYEKVKKAVQDTKGVVMKYQGEYIEPSFCVMSNGMSRSGEEAYKSKSYSYLPSVQNPYDLLADTYLAVQTISKEKIYGKLKEEIHLSKEEVEAMRKKQESIGVCERDSKEYVEKVQVGERKLSGEEFRHIFNLESSCYYIEESGDNYIITTKGVGHGIGLSQYNANEMAKEGKTYEEILKYYYTNIELVIE